MVLGISSFTYGWALHSRDAGESLNEQDLVAQTIAFGLKCLQIGDNLPLHTFPPARLSALQKAAYNNNVRLEVGARGLTEHHFQRYLDIAASVQAPLLRFVIDEDNYAPGIDAIISILKNFVSHLRKYNVILGIENHDRLKATELVHIMEKISDEHVGICLDSVNSIGAGEGIEWVTEMLAPFTVNLHIKDFVIRRVSHNMGFTVAGAPAGHGMLDLSMVMDKVLKYDRCQSAVLEQWVVPEKQLDETLKKEKQWATDGISYLKHLPYFETNTSL
jgi:sugar phosphate isomerase/epimerase